MSQSILRKAMVAFRHRAVKICVAGLGTRNDRNRGISIANSVQPRHLPDALTTKIHSLSAKEYSQAGRGTGLVRFQTAGTIAVFSQYNATV